MYQISNTCLSSSSLFFRFNVPHSVCVQGTQYNSPTFCQSCDLYLSVSVFSESATFCTIPFTALFLLFYWEDRSVGYFFFFPYRPRCIRVIMVVLVGSTRHSMGFGIWYILGRAYCLTNGLLWMYGSWRNSYYS
ncbi:hypothetical protein EV426DRAFT_137776 [Tirmania nivea]|nr:hypothetical protein EV426DRAFT_137776 [Tirmania nivea]